MNNVSNNVPNDFSNPKQYLIDGAVPDLIQVQYDVSEAKVRNKLRHALITAGFQPQTLSVYFGRYSPELMAELEEIRKQGNADVKYMTPRIPSDQLTAWLALYEKRFIESFDEVNKLCAETERMLADELLKPLEGGGERPYSAKEISSRLRYARYELEAVSAALEKRRMREKRTDPSIFEALGMRLRQVSTFLDKLESSCAQRKARESKAPSGEGVQ